MNLIRVRVPAWEGAERKTREVFRLRLRDSAREVICTEAEHDLGWELRITIAGELRQSAVCRTHAESEMISADWLRRLAERGWMRIDRNGP